MLLMKPMIEALIAIAVTILYIYSEIGQYENVY